VELETCENKKLTRKESRLKKETNLGRTQKQVEWQKMGSISLLIPS